MTGVLTSLLTAIAIPVVFWLLARKYPAPQLSAEGPSLEALWPKYRKWEWIILVAYMALWFPVSAAIYWPLHLVARWRAEGMQDNPDTFVFFVDGAALWIPAFFMALLLSGVVLTPALKFLLKERYAEYERFAALRIGFDQNRAMKGLAIVFSSAFILAVFALFDAYFVASPNQLRVNPLLGFERQYAYGDVSEIVTAPALIAPNGKTVHKRVYVVRFRDGTFYTTDNMPEYEVGDRSPTLLIQYIVHRSGVSPKEKAVFERGEL
jgi:hypothetical protein